MKNIVITGSTKGIGVAMALEFLRFGCNVTISGRSASLQEATNDLLEQQKGRFIYIPCDVQSQTDVQNLWDISIQKWGSIDIWINNAGQNTPHTVVWETTQQHTQRVINTNLLGVIYGSQVAAAGMLAQGHGAIYSMEGLGSNNMIQRKTILYGTTKHALTYFMKGLAKELKGTNVIAGRLSPGMMLTDFITKTSEGEPSENMSSQTFVKLFNTLADMPETVARYFVPKILNNSSNDAHIVWLTSSKAAWRFMTMSWRKGRLL